MAKIVIEVDTKTGQSNVKRLDDGFEKLDKRVDKTKKGMSEFEKKTSKTLKRLAGATVGIFAVAALAQYSKELARIADTYTLIDSKINLGTDSLEEFNQAYEELYSISRRTGSQLEVNAQAFNKLALSGMDVSLDDLLRSQEILNKSLVVGGATTAEASSFMLQYSQAMGSGVVNGDELRSMNEANASLMAKIGKLLGTNIAGLKKMGEEGSLTSELFFRTLLKIGGEVDEQFGQIPITIERSLSDLSQVWKRLLADSNKAGDGSRNIAEAITDLAETLDDNREEISDVFVGLIDSIPDVLMGIEEVGRRTLAIADSIGKLANLSGSLGVDSLEWGIIGYALLKGPKGAGGLATALIVLNDQFKHFGINIGSLPGKYFAAADATQVFFDSFADAVTGRKDWDGKTIIKGLSELEKKYEEVQHRLVYTAKGREWKKKTLADIKEIIQALNTQADFEGINADIIASINFETRPAKAAIKELNSEFHNSAKKWMTENGKNAEKTIKKYITELGKANAKILDATSDLYDELQDLSREGMTDTNAWKSVIAQIEKYQKAADAAGKAGKWDEQLNALERAKDLISELPSEGIKIDVSEKDVARAKAVAEASARAARGFDVQSNRNQAAKDLKAYQDLWRQQKAGGRVQLSETDALNQKTRLTREIGEDIIKVREANAAAIKKEADTYKITFETYKKELEKLKDETGKVATDTKEVGAAWVEVGGVWQRVSDEMVTDVNKVKAAVGELKSEMSGAGVVNAPQVSSEEIQKAQSVSAENQKIIEQESEKTRKIEAATAAHQALKDETKKTLDLSNETLRSRTDNVETLKKESAAVKTIAETSKTGAANIKESLSGLNTDTAAISEAFINVGGVWTNISETMTNDSTKMSGELSKVGESWDSVSESMQDDSADISEAYFKVGDTWTNVSQGMVSDVDNITESVKKLNSELLKAQSSLNSAKSGSSSPDRQLANGGNVSAGESILLGENGPERFTPNTNGNITSNFDLKQGSRSVVNLNLSIGGSEPVTLQGTKNSVDQLQRIIADKARYSG